MCISLLMLISKKTPLYLIDKNEKNLIVLDGFDDCFLSDE